MRTIQTELPRLTRRIARLTSAVALVASAAACAAGGAPIETPTAAVATSPPNVEPTPSPVSTAAATARPTSVPSSTPKPVESGPTDSPPPLGATDVFPYFLLADPTGRTSPTLVPVRRAVEEPGAEAALDELLFVPGAGSFETDSGIGSAIPEGTTLLGLDIADGVATVDLSAEFDAGGGDAYADGARFAQVVYTLTRFPAVREVRFLVQGEPVMPVGASGPLGEEPVSRDNFLEYLPSIFVDTPAWNDNVFGPGIENDVPGRYLVQASGIANVFEAQFHAALLATDGTTLEEEVVMAQCGTGCWGQFEVILGADQAGEVILRTWTLSARDGSPEDVREYPLTFTDEGDGSGCC